MSAFHPLRTLGTSRVQRLRKAHQLFASNAQPSGSRSRCAPPREPVDDPGQAARHGWRAAPSTASKLEVEHCCAIAGVLVRDCNERIEQRLIGANARQAGVREVERRGAPRTDEPRSFL